MMIKSGRLFKLGAVTILVGAMAKIILQSEKGEEVRYWLEYHANRLGIFETEKQENL